MWAPTGRALQVAAPRRAARNHVRAPTDDSGWHVLMASRPNDLFPDDCGARIHVTRPGEVANEPSLGHHYMFYATEGVNGVYELHRPYQRTMSKKMVWQTIALNARDQLRQRVAWALAQIYVINEESLTNAYVTEQFLTFYDILVRRAFGSFKDLLREVAYSPAMGMTLTCRMEELEPMQRDQCIGHSLPSSRPLFHIYASCFGPRCKQTPPTRASCPPTLTRMRILPEK